MPAENVSRRGPMFSVTELFQQKEQALQLKDNKQQAYQKSNSDTPKTIVTVSYPEIIWVIKVNHPSGFSSQNKKQTNTLA